MTPTRRSALTMIALVGIVLALYSFTFQCGYIGLDDDTHSRAPHVIGGLTWAGIRESFTQFHGSQWIPLSYVSHMVDVSLFGTDPGGPHLVNVALHALNACLVLLVLFRLTREFWPSAIVAALFAVHPVNVEGVAWLAERKNCLSATFWLLTMLAYARYAEKPRPFAMATVAVILALGLLAKPVLVTLPCVLLLLDVWPLRRHETTPWRRLILEKWPLYLLVIADSMVTLAAGRSEGHIMDASQFPLAARFANSVTSYVRYLGLLVWPADLAILYPVRFIWPLWSVAISASALLATTALLWCARKSQPHLLIGWLWFLGVLFPVCGVFQIGSQSIADRFLYLPQLGVWCSLVFACRCFWKSRIFAGATVAILTLFAATTVQQVRLWGDKRTLFEHTLKVAGPQNIIHFYAGVGCAEQEDFGAAVLHFRAAMQNKQTDAMEHCHLADALYQAGQKDEAIAELKKALELEPRLISARDALVKFLTEQGRAKEAQDVRQSPAVSTPH